MEGGKLMKVMQEVARCVQDDWICIAGKQGTDREYIGSI
jgi:hypothetical protein